MTKITLLLADDHTVVRQGLRAFLSGQPDLDVIGEAGTGREAVQLAGQLKPNVIIMDIAMPILNGLEATRQIVAENPEAKVIILSSYSDDEYVEKTTEAGAIGYLLKQTASSDVVKAIHEAHAGNAYFSPVISKRMLEHYRRAFVNGQPVKRGAVTLTPRESEILQLIAEGNTNKVIADVLKISVKTVEKHRQALMNRLNIHEIAGLTRYAIAQGIIEAKPAMNPPAAN